MIARPHNAPKVVRELEATVCWMADEPLRERGRYSIRHTATEARAIVQDLRYALDVNTLHRDTEATELGLNDIGRVSLKLSKPLMVDAYRDNRETGAFILVDEDTNETVGAGMVLEG